MVLMERERRKYKEYTKNFCHNYYNILNYNFFDVVMDLTTVDYQLDQQNEV
jgi:hypothetical protein